MVLVELAGSFIFAFKLSGWASFSCWRPHLKKPVTWSLITGAEELIAAFECLP